jgi:hypothetical protein
LVFLCCSVSFFKQRYQTVFYWDFDNVLKKIMFLIIVPEQRRVLLSDISAPDEHSAADYANIANRYEPAGDKREGGIRYCGSRDR